MKTITEKKQNLEQIRTVLMAENARVNELVAVHYPDYKIRSNVNWDDLRITIQHSVYQWTDFVSCNINKDGFTFSHGSGGWNEIDSVTKLKITKEIFEIIQFIMDNTNVLWGQTKKVLKLQSQFSVLSDKIKDEERILLLERASLEIVENGYKIVSKNETLETIKNGGTIILSLINIKSTKENEWESWEVSLENRGIDRINYYYNNSSFSKKEVESLFERNTFYIREEKQKVA